MPDIIQKQTPLWKAAQLFIAFHKNKQKQTLDKPNIWSPKGAKARLLGKPEDQEAFVRLEGHDPDNTVQIKFRQNAVGVTRNRVLGWSGIIFDDDGVRVQIDNDFIEIEADGTVKVTRDADTNILHGDGVLMKLNPYAEIAVSADGSQVIRKTKHQIDVISEDGIASRRLE